MMRREKQVAAERHTNFGRAVRRLMADHGVTLVDMGRALMGHRELVDTESARKVAERLLMDADTRATLPDLFAWEAILPGCVQAALTAFGTGLDVVPADDAHENAHGLQRAALEAAGASGEVLAVVARATDPASPGGAQVTTAEAAQIERAVAKARPQLATVARTARAAAPGGVTDERTLAARNKGLAR